MMQAGYAGALSEICESDEKKVFDKVSSSLSQTARI